MLLLLFFASDKTRQREREKERKRERVRERERNEVRITELEREREIKGEELNCVLKCLGLLKFYLLVSI